MMLVFCVYLRFKPPKYTTMNPSDRYTPLLAEAEQRLRHIKQRIWRVSMLRVLLFMAGITALIYFFHAAGWVLTLSLCCTFIPFFALVKLHNRLFQEKTWTETEIRIYQEELKALQGDYSAFDGGKTTSNLHTNIRMTWTCSATAHCSRP